MRLPGFWLRTPVTIEKSLGNTGDGPTYGPPRTTKAHVRSRTQVVFGNDGATRYLWAELLLRHDDPISVDDRITVDGQTRPAATVDPVHGPGGRISHIRVQAGDG